eukprot:CAMPEP_0184042440 /NCGR_PEP_ID=MMETSP0955-20130417/66350_1 /TAXON_ID=627963 /ORGANISM="Aplanochytrium sp, Strain PBS07" /LENGTH=676 /DNA_ID=CAMNT_0026333199 /DNA_START=13 /DNA_END=2043 /DNA_ORIENTATION=-
MGKPYKVEKLAEGTLVQKFRNGTTVRVYKDGHVVQIDKLGNSISKFPDGRTIKMIKSDVGVVKLEEHKDGTKIQTNPDGVRMKISPDGTIEQTNIDGTIIQLLTNKTKIQKNVDGSVIKIFPDGTRIQSYPNGKEMKIDRNGTITLLAEGTKDDSKPSSKTKNAQNSKGKVNVVKGVARMESPILPESRKGEEVGSSSGNVNVVKLRKDSKYSKTVSLLKVREDGVHVQRNLSGVWKTVIKNPKTESCTQIAFDGTVLKIEADGSKTQFNPDGTLLKIHSNGSVLEKVSTTFKPKTNSMSEKNRTMFAEILDYTEAEDAEMENLINGKSNASDESNNSCQDKVDPKTGLNRRELVSKLYMQLVEAEQALAESSAKHDKRMHELQDALKEEQKRNKVLAGVMEEYRKKANRKSIKPEISNAASTQGAEKNSAENVSAQTIDQDSKPVESAKQMNSVSGKKDKGVSLPQNGINDPETNRVIVDDLKRRLRTVQNEKDEIEDKYIDLRIQLSEMGSFKSRRKDDRRRNLGCLPFVGKKTSLLQGDGSNPDLSIRRDSFEKRIDRLKSRLESADKEVKEYKDRAQKFEDLYSEEKDKAVCAQLESSNSQTTLPQHDSNAEEKNDSEYEAKTEEHLQSGKKTKITAVSPVPIAKQHFLNMTAMQRKRTTQNMKRKQRSTCR